MTRLLSVSMILLFTASTSAHDYWLVPANFTPKSGDAVPVRLFVGEDFKSEQEVPYQPKKTMVLQLQTQKGMLDKFPGLHEGDKPAFQIDAPKAGTAVLRVDRGWSTITLKADKFTAYLKEEGFNDVVKLRADAGESETEGRERYRRCLKTIIQVGPDTDETPTKTLGQLLEIIPRKNPYSLKAGDDLPVKVVFQNKPLSGATITAWHRDGETLTTVRATTNKDGEVNLKLPKSGSWVVRTVFMQRVNEKNPDPPADWESFWSSVTFAIP